MSRFTILQLPNPILKQVSKEVTFPLTQQTTQNIQNLKSAFRQSFLQKQVKTLGLAAPQIGILQRFFIMPKTMNFNGMSLQVLRSAVRHFRVFINPKILYQSQKQVMIPENCLSSGQVIYQIQRSQSITVEYYNTEGDKIEEKLSGIRARVFLHEYDHLDGITMEQRVNLIDQKILLGQKLGLEGQQQTQKEKLNKESV